MGVTIGNKSETNPNEQKSKRLEQFLFRIAFCFEFRYSNFGFVKVTPMSHALWA